MYQCARVNGVAEPVLEKGIRPLPEYLCVYDMHELLEHWGGVLFQW